ncbi:alpha/beta fold hydrolase [Chitinophagales bacterium]|nr:alpha/beta fold hydrolase [Chitinophagales bacterium]
MKEEYLKYHSPTLGIDIEMLIFGHAGLPIIIFPTTKGKYFESRDFKLIEAVRPYVEAGKIKLYCPDSVDAYSWYNKKIHPSIRVRNHMRYDEFIEHEIVDAIRTANGIQKVGVAGASFGAFQALNFAFRHPEKVSHLMAMSGNFDISSFMDGYYDDNVYFNNPIDYMPGNNNPELWNMKIVLAAGEDDICLDATRDMAAILDKKNIEHWFDFHRWAKHDWPLWNAMFPKYVAAL